MHSSTGPVPSRLGGTLRGLLRAVRDALGGATVSRPNPPLVDESLVRLATREDDLYTRFGSGAEAVGMKVLRCEESEWESQLGRLLADHAAGRGVIGFSDGTDADRVQAVFQRQKVEAVAWKDAGGVDAQFDVGVAVTDVHAALAETGTLVCCSDSDHGRCLSLVPPVHVALVRHHDMLPDMVDFWCRCGEASTLPSSISFITGPSKTADIEGILITGVHGPGEVHILLIDD